MDEKELTNIIEAALLAAGDPLSIDKLLGLFPEEGRPESAAIRAALDRITLGCTDRGIELKEVSSGFRLQVRSEYAPWVSKLWEERPARYSRALLETLALIAYRQPITRAEIEDIRGVSVSTTIIKTLLDRGWVRVVGHRDVPGRPALYATTREFLDHFSLKSLSELPTLAEIRDLDAIGAELDSGLMVASAAPPAGSPEDVPHAAATSLAEERAEASVSELTGDEAELDPAQLMARRLGAQR